jgi:hypothetical protein
VTALRTITHRIARVASLLVALIAGCSRTQPAATQPAKPVAQTAERGPVKFTVSVPRDELVVGEKFPLTVEVVAEPGVTVSMPVVKEALGKFEVSSPRTPPDIPDGADRRWTHTYDLRTLETGEHQIPALTMKFGDARNAKPGESVPIDNELSTEPLFVHVASLMTGEFDPYNFRDIKGAVDVPTNEPPAWLKYVIGAVGLGVVILILWMLRRHRSRKPVAAPPPVPAHVWAMQELDRLAAENLVSRGEFHAFFFRLSLIARQYIERRFGIMAAEQTTDEFLREVRTNPVLNDDQRTLLSRFLRLADMVKFAKLQPQPGESEEVFAAARNFVQQTAPRADQASTGGSASNLPQTAEAAA